MNGDKFLFLIPPKIRECSSDNQQKIRGVHQAMRVRIDPRGVPPRRWISEGPLMLIGPARFPESSLTMEEFSCRIDRPRKASSIPMKTRENLALVELHGTCFLLFVAVAFQHVP